VTKQLATYPLQAETRAHREIAESVAVLVSIKLSGNGLH